MWIIIFRLQYVRSEELTLPQLAAVCGELVERWDDLAVYFGNEGSGSVMELRSNPSLNVVIFIDWLARPQMPMRRWLLDEGEYERLVVMYFFFLCSGCLFRGKKIHWSRKLALTSFFLLIRLKGGN